MASTSHRAPALRSALVLLVCLAAPASALAHAVVFPKSSTPGAYERYVLRVPNERNLPTTVVEIQFPPDVRVVSFTDVPGWRLEVRTDAAGRVTGAVWTGTLPVQRFVEFPFMAVNPRTESRLTWPAIQTYANGERVAWTGAEGSKTPASSTSIREADESSSGVVLYVAAAALLLSLVSLGLALRPRGSGS